MMFAVFGTTAANASTSITSLTTIDFEGLAKTAYYGTPNLDTDPPATGLFTVYSEDGFLIGTVEDHLDNGHLHKINASLVPPVHTIQFEYANDAAGVYVRAANDAPFSLQSLDFHSPYDDAGNPHTTIGGGDGSADSDYWDIYGFSDARNPGLLTANVDTNGVPTDPNTGFPAKPAVAHAKVANGIDQTNYVLTPDFGNFGNISSFWIHYHGFPHSPNDYPVAYDFNLKIDNIKLNAPAAVPVPAAVWMFLSGMLGLLAIGKKKSNLAA